MMFLGMPLLAAVFAMAFLGLMGAGAFVALVAVIWILWRFAVSRCETRLVRRLRGADCMLCPQCGYDLTGHEGRINCPECGTALNLEEVKTVWHSFRPRFSGERV